MVASCTPWIFPCMLRRKAFGDLVIGSSLRSKKTWTINGKLDEIDRKKRYNADLLPTVESLIIPAVQQQSFTLLHGPRSSGKSTLLNVASSVLAEDYTVVFADLQAVTLHKGDDIFWDSFGRELVRNNNFLSPIRNVSDFIDTFTTTNWKKICNTSPDKPVILVIDEFDVVYTKGDDATQGSLLGALRKMKQDKKQFSVQSFFGIGTFSILNLTGGTGSPFSVRDAVQCPNLSEEQTKILFKEYADDREKLIDSDVISDIFYRTDGHAGSISFMGKLIDEHHLVKDENHLTRDVWQDIIASNIIQSRLIQWLPMQKMIDTLSAPYLRQNKPNDPSQSYIIPLVKDANEVLVKYVLNSNDPFVPTKTQTEQLCHFLASEGVIVPCDDNGFKVF